MTYFLIPVVLKNTPDTSYLQSPGGSAVRADSGLDSDPMMTEILGRISIYTYTPHAAMARYFPPRALGPGVQKVYLYIKYFLFILFYTNQEGSCR